MKHVKTKNILIYLLISLVTIVLQYRINSLELKYIDLKQELRSVQNNIENISFNLSKNNQKDNQKEALVNQEDFNNAMLESLGAKLPVIQVEINNVQKSSNINVIAYKDSNEESEWRYIVTNQLIKIPVPYAQIQASGKNYYKFRKSDVILFGDGSRLTF